MPAENAARLARLLASVGGAVEHRTVPASHGLSQADVSLTVRWLRRVTAVENVDASYDR